MRNGVAGAPGPPNTAGVHDVAIIGGGPAGAAAARLLSTWGHDVIVVSRPVDAGRSLAVSLPPSIKKLFREVGVLDEVDRAGFVRSTGNTVWWGDKKPRREAFADGETGYQVRHCELEEVLLSAAGAAGATIEPHTEVRDVCWAAEAVRLTSSRQSEAGPACAGRPRVGETRCAARFVLDASGRQGVIARGRDLRVPASDSRIVALTGVWRRDGGWEIPDDSHTLVESFADGWAWAVPVAPGLRYFTAMLDPELSDLAPGDMAQRYADALGRTTAFRKLVAAATPVGEPWGCDASSYRSRRVSGDRFLLIGDAASSIDPLSSFGVKKALASGWLAAVVVNTWIRTPQMHDQAAQVFEEHEQRTYEVLERRAGRYLDDAAANQQHPFWTGRAQRGLDTGQGAGTAAERRASGGIGLAAAGAPAEPDVEVLRRDPQVIAAFEALKASPSIRLRRRGAVRTARQPVVGERLIVLEDRLVAPGLPNGVRFLRGVDARELVALAPGHSGVPDLFDDYNRRCTAVPLADFLGALSVLLAKGFLRNDAVC